MRDLSFAETWFALVAVLVLAMASGGCETSQFSAGNWEGNPIALPSERPAYGVPDSEPPPVPPGEEAAAYDIAELPEPALDGPIHQDRKMVYSARFEVSTPNVEDAMNRFTDAVEGLGGYLESRQDNRVVCRVPAERFDDFVAAMPTLGSILRQSIRNEDVTRTYRDLNLHIETAESSRRRVLALMEKAEKIEDILRLEEELARLTATIEELRGTLRDLSEQIAYSRIEVLFHPKTPQSPLGLPTARSAFPWINRLGVEQLSQGFGSVEPSGSTSAAEVLNLIPGGISVGPLEGFLLVNKGRDELKAITPDASKLWVREFSVPRSGSLEFWSKAVKNDLADHRGYEAVEWRRVKDRHNREGVEMVFDVLVQGAKHRYLITLFVLDGYFWESTSTVRTAEFAAPVATFDKHVAQVRRACEWGPIKGDPAGFPVDPGQPIADSGGPRL